MVKTSLDPSVVIKGTELLSKLEQIDKDRGQTPDDDGLSWWRTCRDYLILPNGASMFMLFCKAAKKDMGHPSNYPLLHDVWNLVQGELFGRQIWDWACQSLSPESRQALDQQLADPKYQAEDRKKVWAEIGVDISKVMKAA
jgi:hypothetical protein